LIVKEKDPKAAEEATVAGKEMKAYERQEKTLAGISDEMLAEFDLQKDYVKYGIVKEQAVSTTAYAVTLAAVVYALAF